jgi:hypothetical protein
MNGRSELSKDVNIRGFSPVTFDGKGSIRDILNGHKVTENQINLTARVSHVDDVVESLKKNHFVVVYGEYGSGVTSTLYHAARHFSRDKGGDYSIFQCFAEDLDGILTDALTDISDSEGRSLFMIKDFHAFEARNPEPAQEFLERCAELKGQHRMFLLSEEEPSFGRRDFRKYASRYAELVEIEYWRTPELEDFFLSEKREAVLAFLRDEYPDLGEQNLEENIEKAPELRGTAWDFVFLLRGGPQQLAKEYKELKKIGIADTLFAVSCLHIITSELGARLQELNEVLGRDVVEELNILIERQLITERHGRYKSIHANHAMALVRQVFETMGALNKNLRTILADIIAEARADDHGGLGILVSLVFLADLKKAKRVLRLCGSHRLSKLILRTEPKNHDVTSTIVDSLYLADTRLTKKVMRECALDLAKNVNKTEPRYHLHTGLLIHLRSFDHLFVRKFAKLLDIDRLADSVSHTEPKYHKGTGLLITGLQLSNHAVARKIAGKVESSLISQISDTVPEYHDGTGFLIESLTSIDRRMTIRILKMCDSSRIAKSISDTKPENHDATRQLVFHLNRLDNAIAQGILEKCDIDRLARSISMTEPKYHFGTGFLIRFLGWTDKGITKRILERCVKDLAGSISGTTEKNYRETAYLIICVFEADPEIAKRIMKMCRLSKEGIIGISQELETRDLPIGPRAAKWLLRYAGSA